MGDCRPCDVSDPRHPLHDRWMDEQDAKREAFEVRQPERPDGPTPCEQEARRQHPSHVGPDPA